MKMLRKTLKINEENAKKFLTRVANMPYYKAQTTNTQHII